MLFNRGYKRLGKREITDLQHFGDLRRIFIGWLFCSNQSYFPFWPSIDGIGSSASHFSVIQKIEVATYNLSEEESEA